MKSQVQAFCALAFALSVTANAVDLDLAGKVFKKGGSISVTSTAAVPAALLYDLRLEANGTGTGTFATIFGSGDLATRLEEMEAGSSRKLRVTLANIPQKLPVTLGQTRSLAGGSIGGLTSKSKVKVEIAKNGIVKASAKKMDFKATDQSGADVPVTGEYTVNTGRFIVEPSPASSATPRPDFIILLNQHFAIGNDEYTATSPGTTDVVPLKRGRSTSDYFVIQNDGPDTDNFKLFRLFPSRGLSVQIFDGKTDITAEAMSANGFAINALPSAGTRLFRLVVKVANDATPGSFLNGGVRVIRTKDANVSDTGGFFVNVR